MARNIIMGSGSFCSEIFDNRLLAQYFELHRERKYNYADQIWTLLNIELWHSIFIKGEALDEIKVLAA